MLPKIYSALVSALSPLASSVESAIDQRKSGDFKKHSQQQKKQDHTPPPPSEKQKTVLKLVPSSPELPKSGIPGKGEDPSGGFLQLISVLQEIRSAFLPKAGARAYQFTIQNLKKTGKIRKGIIMDKEAD